MGSRAAKSAPAPTEPRRPRGGRGPVPVVQLDLPSLPEERESALMALVEDLAMLVVLRHLAEEESRERSSDQEDAGRHLRAVQH